MIALRNVVQSIGKGRHQRDLLSGANFVFSEERIGLAIGSTDEAEVILDLLCGNKMPEYGSVWRDGRASWPVGRIAQYRADLTGKATLHFFTSIYKLRFRECEDLLFGMLDIGKHYNKPMIQWPRNLILEFGYVTSLMPDFDVYIVDSSISTSNDDFNNDFDAIFQQRIDGKQLIYYSTSERFLGKFVKKTACVLDGHFYLFEEIADALKAVEMSKIGSQQTVAPEKPEENFDIVDF